MSAPQLLVHDKKDTVGVVVVEGLAAGTDMLCVVTHDDSSLAAVSPGHVCAVSDVSRRSLQRRDAGGGLPREEYRPGCSG